MAFIDENYKILNPPTPPFIKVGQNECGPFSPLGREMGEGEEWVCMIWQKPSD